MIGSQRPAYLWMAATLFVGTLAVVQFAAYRAHLPTAAWFGSALLALAVAFASARKTEQDAAALDLRDFVGSLLMILLGCAWVGMVFGDGAVLPPGDPIAVPQFARDFAQGRLLTDAYPAGSSGHAYPPGYPVLFAPFAMALSPDGALHAFKIVNLAAVALIPAAWGWLHRRWFAPEQPAWLILGAAYAAFVVAERHLGFLTPFAGKNAVHFALLLAPGCLLAATTLGRSLRLWPLAILPLAGLFLIHYSMLHLSVALLAAWALVELAGRRLSLWEAGRIAAAGAVAVALLLALTPEALADPRAAAVVFSPVQGLKDLVTLALDETPALVIFHDADFGLAPSPYRLGQMALCALIAAAVGAVLRREDLWRPAAVYPLALLASLLFGLNVVPAGINLDFVRCFAWTLQAGLYLTAALALLALVLSWRWPLRAVAAVVAAPLLALALYNTAKDSYIERETYAARALPGAQLRRLDAALPDRGACWLIGDSTHVPPPANITVQTAASWNYAETVSPCRFANGSWVQPGLPGGRDLAGFPGPAALTALPRDAEIQFVGSAASFQTYAAALKAGGYLGTWQALPEVNGAARWRLVRPFAMCLPNTPARS